VFGDTDPEDAWSESDPPPEKVLILVRWALSVADEIDGGDPLHRAEHRLVEALGKATLLSTDRTLRPVARAKVGAVLDLLLALEVLT
jgi:hypothetical protein